MGFLIFTFTSKKVKVLQKKKKFAENPCTYIHADDTYH